jgi:hypothetical protein
VVDFAYLTGGKLVVEVDGAGPREVESAFAAGVAQRTASLARKNAWKTQGRGARFQMGLEGLPDELLESRLKANAVLFTGLSRGRHSAEIVYTLSSGPVAGLFAFSGGHEERVFHGADFVVSEPASEPGGERFACVVRGSNGQTHIGLLVPGQHGVTEVTVGDALDSAPAWIPGQNALLFESRALGYDRAGSVVDVAPATIQKLDLDAALVTPLVSVAQVSCTSPRVSGDGTLHYLKQPVPVARTHWGALLLDALLFPFRLVMAVLQWFNFFSLRYTGKPLVSGGDRRAKQADVKRAAVLGNLATAATELKEDEDALDAARTDSQLVRRDPDGTEHVVARGVRCFDVYADGAVLWSDGRRIFCRDRAGVETCLCKRAEVSELLALEPRAKP